MTNTSGSAEPTNQASKSTLSRRGMLRFTGALGAGAGLGFAGAKAVAAQSEPEVSVVNPANHVYPFRGEHQAGVTTPVQEHLYFAAFDLRSGATRENVIALLKEWTVGAERLTKGQDVTEAGAVNGPPLLPPDDTGEALGMGAHGLTITFGFGASLFTGEKGEQLGLTGQKPAELNPLPLFAFDLIQDEISNGDLCIQACAEDPQVAMHAIRNLSRIAMGTAQIRWTQLGFGKSASTSRELPTPRNLFGFKDGTANVMADEKKALADFVWTPADSTPAWMAGGTYMVTRKIVMTIENWDRVNLAEQETIIGRSKGEGAPLSGGLEFTEPQFKASEANGTISIDPHSHLALAHPEQNNGTRMLRRSFNYAEGNNALGQINAGLFFISFQRTPQQFIDVQNKLKTDLLNEYIRHISSALFAIPAGVAPGEYVGQRLFS